MRFRLVYGLAVVCSLMCVLSTGAASVHAAGGPNIQSGSVAGAVPPKGAVHKAAPLGPDNLTYHGGPVMHSNTTYAIYWLPGGSTFGGSASNYESTINQFFTDVAHDSGGHSNVYSTDPQYYDTVGGGYHYAGYSSTFAGSYVDTNPFPTSGCTDPSQYHYATCLTQAQEAQEVYNVVSSHGWPVGHNDIEYFLFTPQNTANCAGNGTNTDCAYVQYCAYHTYFTVGGAPVVWANMPWTSGISVCDTGARPNSSDADPTINVTSHEHNEAITDPLINGWIDSSNNENGDKCAWNFGTTSGSANQSINGHSYLLQEEWDNSGAQCLQSFTPPTPTITSLTPTFGAVGATVTIDGTGLISPSAVKFNGKDAASFTIVSATEMTAKPAAGTTSGRVTIVTPGGTATSPTDFTMSPTITSFAPTSGSVGTNVTITGANLTGATAVTFNGTAAASFSVDSATQITAAVAIGSTTGKIAVTTPGGTISSATNFTVASVPAVTSFTPTSGGTGTSVTITGSGFTGVTGVTFGGVAAGYSLVSDTQLIATVPIGAVTGAIAVTTLGGTGTSTGTFTFVPAPTVTSFTPTAGPVGTSVTITGTNLTGATAVAFNGTAAASFTVDSATQITAVVAAATTTGTLTVTTPGGAATSSGSFTVIPSPAITSFTPASGPVGTSVTITGTNLTGATAVAFNGTNAASYTVNSATQITATVATATTSGTIAVTTPGGSATSTGAFTVVPAPTVSGFTPVSGPVGTSVTIAGTNLTGATSVRFNGTNAAAFSVDSATQITATVATGTTTGTLSVTTPGGTVASSGSFTVIPAPAVSSFSPTSGPVGTSVTITGTNLTGATAVKFHGVDATSFTVDSATQITATVASGTTTGTVSVATPGGTGTSSGSFTVIPAPTVTGFTPTTGAAGASVTITGTNLAGATAVTFNGTNAASFHVDSATQITATVGAGSTSGTIAVTTPGGSATSSGSFTVIPTPTVSGFTPASGPVGTSVTITGTNLTGATAVKFNGTDATAFSVDSATQITATVASSTTSGTIAITTPGGTATSSGSFTVIQPPTITLVSPSNGPVGTSVTITGTNLTGASAVKFNGTDAASYTVNSATQITAVVAAGSTTGMVTVATSAGTATSAQTFTVYLQPTITDFSPTTTGQGNVVAINGTNFTGANSVKFGGTAAQQFFVSDTQIVAIVGTGASGAITVHTPGGTATSSQTFTFVPPPTVTGFTPTTGPVGTAVTITGTNLSGASSVKFNGTDAASYTVDSATQITATVAAGTTSGTIAVRTLGGIATSSGAFTVVPAPTITSLSPTSGPVGTSVTITGTNLTGATAVKFHGTDAASFSIDSATQITAVVAGGATSGTVAVTTPGGTTTSGSPFTVVPAPAIAGFTPTSGPAGIVVTITGTSLTAASSVKFNGTDAASFSVDSATQITATVANGTTTGTISVTTAGGSATSSGAFTVLTAPTVSSFTPTSGPVGTSVMIAGAGFSGVTAVAFGGTAAADYSVDSSTQITATVAIGTASGTVSVTTLGGTGTSSGTFTVVAAPTVTSFTPSSGPVGTSVTITGSSLSGATGVSFNGTPAESFVVESATQISAVVASGTTSGHVSVTTPGGTGASSGSFTVVASPTVSGFTPASGPAGTSVTLSGSNLSGATAVQFHGTDAASFTVDSATQITAVVAGGTTSGTVSVTTPGGTATSSGAFTVIPTPTVSSFTPATGPVGTTVTITGTNLADATAVSFAGTSAESFSVDSATQITATVGSDTTSGKIAVTTPGGTATSSNDFAVVQPPSVTSFTPDSGPVGTVVTINGANLTDATAVTFDGTDAATYTVDSATQITATVASGTDSGDVSVTTAGGAATSSDEFTVTASAPAIVSFSPASGGSGTLVEIDGSNFSGATAVDLGGTPASAFTVLDDNTIQATAGTGGTGHVAVTTPGGIATSDDTFTYYDAPVITSFTPSSGVVGTSVTLTGSGFDGATEVDFGGDPADAFSVDSDAQITVNVPDAATTGSIGVVGPGGTTTSDDEFTVIEHPAPVVDSFAPTSGVVGSTITVTGSDLSGATAVTIGGTDAESFSVVSGGELTAVVATDTTSGPVDVTTPGGTAESADSFTVLHPPSVDSFSPASGRPGEQVTITGTNFTGATAVDFGTTAATSLTVDSDTQITAAVPAAATSGPITVVTPDGTDTSADSFTVFTSPAPVVSSFSPAKGAVGTRVTIKGTNFTGATAVSFGGTPASPVTVTAASVTVLVPAGATSGKIDVTTPTGGTGKSSATFWLYAAIVSFSPDGGPDGTHLTINGSGFDGATGVKVNATNVSSFTVVSDTKITATVAPGTTTGYVTVTTPAGSARSVAKYTADWISSLSPSKGAAGTKVTISGSGFTGATSVRFHGTLAASFTVTSNTKISAVVAAGTTTGAVTVVTPNGTLTSATSFGMAPHIESFSPSVGVAGATVTINGSGFVGTTGVTFNTTAASDVTVVNDSKITATIAAKTTSGYVSVTTPGGTVKSATKLSIVGVTTFSPTKGAAGTKVTISGSGLSDATAVRFNGTDAATYTVVSDTKITAVVAEGTTSGPLTVDTSHGTAESVASFGIVPHIDSFDPSAARPGDSITITGSGFTGATAVKINGKPATGLAVVDDSTITATVADKTTSGYVSVTTPGGTATSKSKLAIVALTSFAPAHAAVGATVTIAGSGLTGATGVSFNGTDAASFHVVSDSKVTAVVAAGTTSGAVHVDTPHGTVTSSADFEVTAAVASLAPEGGPAGTTVTVTGSGFSDAAEVELGSISVDFTVVDDAHIAFDIPDDAASGRVAVRTGAGTVTSAHTFRFLSVNALSPEEGAAGETVTITGSGFTGATAVEFAGVDARSFKVVSDTKITAVVPSGTSSGDVTVTTPDGEAASPTPFAILGGGENSFSAVQVSPERVALGAR